MRLLIVIVNYRTASLTIDCLRSLADELPSIEGTRVIITDNASGDESVEQIGTAIHTNNWQAWAEFMPLGRNGGFAYGNNAGIGAALKSEAPPAYVLLLNPDTVARPGAIRALLDFMDEHPGVGIAGSRLENPDGTPQRSAFRFPSVLSELESGLRMRLISKLLSNRLVAPPVSDRAGPTDWIAGASMIVRREVFDAIGLMDERYFMYFEEVDFCLRARRAGWPCWYVPGSRIVHLVGQSSGVTDVKKARNRRPAYWFASRRWFFVKNYGRLRTMLADLTWATAYATYRLRRPLQRKPDTDPQYLLRDFIRYNLAGATRFWRGHPTHEH
jgi:GT2 family glycosyltransferase